MDSPVIVNAEVDEFYKQPMYYALGHVTRFIPEGSVRIGLNLEQGQDDIRLTYSAAERPDGAIAFIVMNRYVMSNPASKQTLQCFAGVPM